MADLSKDILYDIYSRILIKSLVCFRCVCKHWREYINEYINDPHLATIHPHVKEEPRLLHHALIVSSRTLCGHQKRKRSKSSIVFQSDVSVLSFLGVTEDDITIDGIKVKKDLSSIFQVKRSSLIYQRSYEIQGYCNGLITLLAQGLGSDESTTTYVVINPLTKECHQLPPMKKQYTIIAQGLGFDHSTNTFKMVCSVNDVKQNLTTLTLVHVLGTDSWREIPQVSLYRVIDGEAVYANGLLYWFARTSGWIIGSHLVWFDINKEEFGVIDLPKKTEGLYSLWLVDINGELGCVYRIGRPDGDEVVVWILKHGDQWMIHCVFKQPDFSYGLVSVLGCWNKDGDLLLRSSSGGFPLFVYRLKSGSFHKLIGPEAEEREAEVRMYQSSLLSIRKWH